MLHGGEETKLLGCGESDDPAVPDKAQAAAVGSCASVKGEVTDSCLCFLKVMSIFTMAAGALIIAVNVYEIIDVKMSYQMYAVRGYAVLFGLMIILAELEFPRLFLDYFQFLDLWSMKGFFIVFVGVLTLDTESNDNNALQTGTAGLVVVLGCVYIILGLLCVKTYRDHRKQGIRASSADAVTKKAAEGPIITDEPVRARPPVDATAPDWLDPQKDPGV